MKALKNLTVQILIATVLGVAFGLIVGDWAGNLKFVGDMFIRLIQMSIVPLVMTSVIVATGALTGKGAGQLGLRTFTWMIGFSLLAAVLAYLLSILIRPGSGMVFEGDLDPSLEDSLSGTVGWQETILNFVSTNVVEAMAKGSMVPIIVFALLFGAALNLYTRQQGDTQLVSFFEATQKVVLRTIQIVMRIAPIGIFCLLANLAGKIGFAVVTTALAYLGATLLGVVILALAFLLVVVLRTGLNPLQMLGKFGEQTVIALTTTSSAVTFPTVLKNAVEKFGVSQRVANFTLSIGLTMGSYGAVLNYMIVVMFLAQAGGIELSVGQIVLGMGLAILLNMGTITVPGGFPVVAMFLASSIGLPFEAVGLLIAVDWFTGMFRTFLNVNGDTMVAMLVANPSGDLDRDVFYGRKAVAAEAVDLDALKEEIEAADADQ